MKSYSITSKSNKDLNFQLDSFIQSNFKPTLAIVNTSVEFDIIELIKTFKDRSIQLLGITSSGEIYNDKVTDKSASVLLLDANENHFKIISAPLSNDNEFIESKKLGEIAKKSFKKSSILVYTSGISTNGEKVLEGLKKADNHNIYGALAGDDLKMDKSFIFTNEEKFEKGVSLLIFDDEKYFLDGGAYSGWESIGTEKKITKAIGNKVYEIDNKPALEVFKDYFRNNADLANKTTEYPLQVIRDGIPVLRCPLVINEQDQSLTFAGTLFNNEPFKFCVPPDFDIIETTINHFDKKSDLNKPPEAVILVSCIARKLAFGPLLNEEIKGIYNIYNKPMIGLFSYGEIGIIEDRESEFHNETCTLIIINERN